MALARNGECLLLPLLSDCINKLICLALDRRIEKGEQDGMQNICDSGQLCIAVTLILPASADSIFGPHTIGLGVSVDGYRHVWRKQWKLMVVKIQLGAAH